MSEKILLTIPDFAAAVGISRTTAYGLIKKRIVPVVELGGIQRVPVVAIEKLIARQLRERESSNGPDQLTT